MSIFDIFKKSKKDYNDELKKYEDMVKDFESKVMLDIDEKYITKHPGYSLGVGASGGNWDAGIDDFRITKNRMVETDEAKVVRILKGDFEKKFGITFDKFTETYHKMLEKCPEKLI